MTPTFWARTTERTDVVRTHVLDLRSNVVGRIEQTYACQTLHLSFPEGRAVSLRHVCGFLGRLQSSEGSSVAAGSASQGIQPHGTPKLLSPWASPQG